MIKYLALGAVLTIVYFLFFRKKHETKENDVSESETMVECANCGIFISSKEGKISHNQFFCSKKCLEDNKC